jgi:thiol:disulfide interchange protein
MKKIFFIAVLVSALQLLSKAQGIEFFKGTWAQALEKAKQENKPVFVDAYTVWCGPCKYMAASVFTVDSVGEYYNKNFINYKFDMEKGEGPEFASKYRVTAYPTLLYLTSDGKVLHRVMGAKQPEGFINEGRKAIVVNEYK